MYLKVETDDKNKIVSIFQETIEQSKLHRIYTSRLENGDYQFEVMEAGTEPAD